jgi:hypothetical protein
MITRDNPYTNPHIMWNIQLAYDKMKQIVISQKYDKVLVVESDMVIPEDTLQKLNEIDAPSVSALYVLRRGQYSPNVRHPIKTSHFKWGELRDVWGQIIDTIGGCMGCVLLTRDAIKDFDFLNEQNPNAPDVPLMEYHWKNGFKQKARLDVICGHKKLNGEVLWPDKEHGFIIRSN